VRKYIETAPAPDNAASPSLAPLTEQFRTYLHYVAAMLEHFCERTTETIERLRDVTDDTTNPVQRLAEARAMLALDPVMARTEPFQPVVAGRVACGG
jgi:hypothetical protein